MFTGLVDHTARLLDVTEGPGFRRLVVGTGFCDLVPGESVAVDGACLTVVAPEEGKFRCDLSSETLALTIAGGYAPGHRVNVERALRFSDRLGGHLVTGHVDQRGVVTSRKDSGEFLELTVGGVRPELHRYLHRKGSVAVQGVSLTVNALTPDGFCLTLVPHTLERTNLGQLAVGDGVNLEFDWMTKVILHEVDRRQS